ncbi:UDP-3-O-(3-hydroxymyristoyl)glucosamine N-acyltransferase [Deferrisoma camini]|uniref:UDP-3-O-(3-hydroxymyristoyl)glucosamine N-acyltransferase n=1 Tax=Deferrisoma camini TaxID=1035120 RepID=UPI00046D7D95|nr:UDP-3-O-(3-hydroxymyristoyl)glucosamine N-acyltransferase [Deferrisoma camini]
MTLGELAEKLGAELRGDPAVEVTGVATLDRAGPGEVSFLSNPKYRPLLATTRAAAVIVAPAEAVEGRAALVTENPYLAFARAVELLHPRPRPEPGVHEGAWIHPDARLEEGVTALPGSRVDAGARVGAGTVLYPGVYVGRGARVGRGCVLHANAVVREECVLGDRVVLQPGAVVGSDGYGYARDGHRHVPIPQVGRVVLEDDVEVGANTTIDRAALGETRIGRGTKIDNLVQIGHNVTVGEDCLIVAQVGVSGSTRIGHRVVLAGQVGVAGHLRVGDGAMVGAQSGIGSDVPAGAVVSGSPAIPHGEWLRAQAVVKRLPDLRREMKAMERRLAELEARVRGRAATSPSVDPAKE